MGLSTNKIESTSSMRRERIRRHASSSYPPWQVLNQFSMPIARRAHGPRGLSRLDDSLPWQRMGSKLRASRQPTKPHETPSDDTPGVLELERWKVGCVSDFLTCVAVSRGEPRSASLRYWGLDAIGVIDNTLHGAVTDRTPFWFYGRVSWESRTLGGGSPSP